MRHILFSLCFILFAGQVLADPPIGTDYNSPEHKWWECQLQPSGVICCSEADGHVLKDSDWRVTQKGYEIRVNNVWFKVPAQAVINETVKCGPEPNIEHRTMAKAWYDLFGDNEIHIYCFEAGTMY